MPTHLFNEKMLPDDLFVAGMSKHLVVGNECRLLDKRRTPGVVKSIDLDGGFFRWEISDFEDKGKYWDVEFERVSTYQFKKGARELRLNETELIDSRVKSLNQLIEVVATESNAAVTNQKLNAQIAETKKWLMSKSEFFRSSPAIDFQCLKGPLPLRSDFNRFILGSGMSEIESRTAEIQVLNPLSGDWIKAMQIVMAEMGLKDYRGKAVRSSGAFDGIGTRVNRRRYIEYRLSFIRAVFELLNLTHVELYRGMSTEWDWKPDASNNYRFWSSWTFNHQVAHDFSELKPGTKQKNSYLIKRAIPIERLFMTFLETDAMNRQYLEAEALVLHNEEDRMLW